LNNPSGVNIAIHSYTDELETEKQLILLLNCSFDAIKSNNPIQAWWPHSGEISSDLFQHGVDLAAEDKSIQT
jgi:hypothetical protein